MCTCQHSSYVGVNENPDLTGRLTFEENTFSMTPPHPRRHGSALQHERDWISPIEAAEEPNGNQRYRAVINDNVQRYIDALLPCNHRMLKKLMPSCWNHYLQKYLPLWLSLEHCRIINSKYITVVLLLNILRNWSSTPGICYMHKHRRMGPKHTFFGRKSKPWLHFSNNDSTLLFMICDYFS